MMEINLLAPHHRRRPVAQIALLILLLALAVALFAASFLQFYQTSLIRTTRLLTESQVSTETVRREAAAPDPKDRRLLEAYADLTAGRPDFPVLLESISRALPAQGKLSLIAFEAPGTLEVSGTLPNLQAVAGYMNLLQQSGKFTAVTNPVAMNAGATVQFTLVLELGAQGVSE